MSRHRDIRNMDYSEDYDGYDDIYGHSVDDDIYISPSHRQFMYNRENSGQSRSDISMEEDIQEEDETDEEAKLSDEDKAKLESCLDHVKSVFVPLRMPRSDVVRVIIAQKFDCEKIVNSLLKASSSPKAEKKDKDDTIRIANSFHKSLFNPIKQSNHSSTQKVEPQSNIVDYFLSKLDCHGTQNDSQSDICSTETINKEKKLVYDSPSTVSMLESSSSSTRSNLLAKCSDSNLTNSFLCKIKKPNSDPKPAEVAPVVSSFLSGLKSNEMNAHHMPFLSKISKGNNGLQKNLSNEFLKKITKRGNSENLMTNPLQSSPESIRIQEEKIESPLFKLTPSNGKIYHQDLNTSSSPFESPKPRVSLNSNGMKIPVNDKLKKFLSKIEQKGSESVMEDSKSEITLSITKPQNLAGDLSKLKLTDVKSMPSLGNRENDHYDINLTTALQKCKFENFVFRPAPKEEDFDIPFMCDGEMDEEEIVLECTMDLSHLARQNVLFYKNKPSSLGKTVCLRFKMNKIHPYKMKKLNLDSRLTKFNFLEPSPDDQIKKHMKRNL